MRTTVHYVETIERKFEVETDDPAAIIRGLREGSLHYVPAEDDRSAGSVVSSSNIGQGWITSGDYGVVMRRSGFNITVDWPRSAFLKWYASHARMLHRLSAVIWGITFIMALAIFKGNMLGTTIFALGFIPMFICIILTTWIGTKRHNLGADINKERI